MIKKVISAYGDFLQEMVLLTAVLLLVFRFLPAGNGTYGIGNVLGSNVKSEGFNYAAYVDTAASAKVLGRTKPVIEFDPYAADGEKTSLVAGKDLTLSEYFRVTDAEGAAVTTIRIKSITNQVGTELLSGQLTQTDVFQFPAVGIYQMKVSVTDSKNQCSTRTFRVPVVSSMQEG